MLFRSIPVDINDETQSMNDMNTKSVGKLLHEMVTIYGLCGDTINFVVFSFCILMGH